MRDFKKRAFAILLLLSCVSFGCGSHTEPENTTNEPVSEIENDNVSADSHNDTTDSHNDTTTTTATDETVSDTVSTNETTGTQSPLETEIIPADNIIDYIRLNMPRTDGSTSTIPLDVAVRAAIFGEAIQSVSHSTTYMSLKNLVWGYCDVIFTTPMSEEQLEFLAENDFDYEMKPVAGEGFVFVVNRDNPVDSLTVEQLKGIYSGEITNWSEVGGDDVEIIAYQRNTDSGSQNYMRAFMGDTPLMEPLTDQIPSSMYSILDVVANYENSVGAIGYSVYSYSDGMYEDLSKIKYIKVNGVEPSLENLYDGSYPLLGYNYAIYSAELDENSPTRALVDWMRSDEGQAVVASAGYVPYRSVDGLVLPTSETDKLYNAMGTGKGTVSDADYSYYARFYDNELPVFASDELNTLVNRFLDDANAELDKITDEELERFAKERGQGAHTPVRFTNYRLENGYLSVIVGYRYGLGYELSPPFYYKVHTAVFDIYTNERLELCDLFPDGYDFVPELNRELSESAVYLFKDYYDMIREFDGLVDGNFQFTHDSIFIEADGVFADGVELSLSNLRGCMLTSNPRDMDGLLEKDGGEIRIGFNLNESSRLKTYTYLEKGEPQVLSLWLLDSVKLPNVACDKLNAFACELCETKLTDENFLRLIDDAGIDRESLKGYVLQPYPDVSFTTVGERYAILSGPSQIDAIVESGDIEEVEEIYLDIFEYERSNPYWFGFFFNAQTGEPLQICDLFTSGWQNEAMVCSGCADIYELSLADARPLSELFDDKSLLSLRITGIYRYSDAIVWPDEAREDVVINVVDAAGDAFAIFIPSRFIKV